MIRGKLEVTIVHAEGIRQPNYIGSTKYHVIVELPSKEANHRYRSKSSTASGKDGKIRWNERCDFDFLLTEWAQLSNIKFRIMGTKFFKGSEFVGETKIFLGGIVKEGTRRGFLILAPSQYNVVLEDDTYKGKITIGFRFTISNDKEYKKIPLIRPPRLDSPGPPLFVSLFNLWRYSLWKFW